jgi:hypothetical protein
LEESTKTAVSENTLSNQNLKAETSTQNGQHIPPEAIPVGNDIVEVENLDEESLTRRAAENT